MTALEMASVIEADCPFDLSEAAALLRRQHEAIVKLREALAVTSVALRIGHNTLSAIEQAEQALKDTEEIAK